MRFPWQKPYVSIDNHPTLGERDRGDRILRNADETIKRAEDVIVLQNDLTRLVHEGRHDEFLRVATGVFPADIAADRFPRRPMPRMSP